MKNYEEEALRHSRACILAGINTHHCIHCRDLNRGRTNGQCVPIDAGCNIE